MHARLSLNGYEPDAGHEPAVAFRIRVGSEAQEIPRHQHRKGQLIMALRGGVTCEVKGAVWMVPPQFAVWIPGELPHSNRATANAQLCFLFIEPEAVVMPQTCCTLKISALVCELILTLAARRESPAGATQRLVQLLFDELPGQPVQQLQLPVSDHPGIRMMIEAMVQRPDEWRTKAAWAKSMAMSERTFTRLVQRETGLNFRRWRQQLQLIIALRLLVSGQNVQQVAQYLGYDSTTAFITLFKKRLGQTPGRYLASLVTDGEGL